MEIRLFGFTFGVKRAIPAPPEPPPPEEFHEELDTQVDEVVLERSPEPTLPEVPADVAVLLMRCQACGGMVNTWRTYGDGRVLCVSCATEVER